MAQVREPGKSCLPAEVWVPGKSCLLAQALALARGCLRARALLMGSLLVEAEDLEKLAPGQWVSLQ